MASYRRSIQRLRAHLKAAYAYSELSYAKRLKVGAVLIKDDRIISVGYNGMPSGMDNNCEYDDVKGWNIKPNSTLGDGRITELKTRPEVVHAEMNAIAFAAKHGVPTEDCTMVVTHSPCYECSKLLIQAGVKEIYYDVEYRDMSSIEFLTANNITILRIPNESEENGKTS